jgi:hypothetical protein
MKCSRCAAELPDSSVFCSMCGAANPSSQLTTSSFSYLPAGAPPWPASVPGRYSYGAGSPAPVQPITPHLPEKSGRSVARTVMTFALILLITLLVGVGGTLGVLASQGHFSPQAPAAAKKVVVPQTQNTPATSATPAPTTSAQTNQLPDPTSFKLTSVKDVNAALEYPSNWVQDALQKTTDGNSLGIHSPQAQQLGISFFLMRFSTSTSDTITSPDQINQSNIQQFSTLTGVSNMQTLPSNGSAPTIGGTSWMELDASFTNANSVKLDLTSISVEHNKLYYNIVVVAPDAYYTEAMQKYIQHMFTTFKFLS